MPKFFVRVERMWGEGGNGSSLYFSFFLEKKITLKFSLALWSQVILCGHIFEFCVFKINKSRHFILKFARLTPPYFDISNDLISNNDQKIIDSVLFFGVVFTLPRPVWWLHKCAVHLSQAESRAVSILRNESHWPIKLILSFKKNRKHGAYHYSLKGHKTWRVLKNIFKIFVYSQRNTYKAKLLM